VTATVRRAVPADAGGVAECLAELGYGTPAALVAEKLAELAGSARDAVFVAEVPPDRRIAGVVSAHVLPLFHAPGNAGRITALAVRGEAQGAGVGRALVEAAEAFAWAAGCRRVEVTSGDHRPGAHAFYRALGYALDERRFLKHAPPGAPAPPARAASGPARRRDR
jgi:GNAT superfamily N-acetyltransferase